MLRPRKHDQSRDHRRDQGAVTVEAALMIPLLLILAFGMIELALLLRDNVAATTLAREGARTASAEPRVSSFVLDAVNGIQRSAATLPDDTIEEIWVYQAGPQGFPIGQTSFAACTANCVKYGWVDPPGPTPGSVTVLNGGAPGWAATSVNACLADANAQSVGVYVQTNHPWLLGFFPGSGTKIRAWTVMKFEPIVKGQCR